MTDKIAGLRCNKETYCKLSGAERNRLIRETIKYLKKTPVTKKDNGEISYMTSTGDALVRGVKYKEGTIVVDDCIVLRSYHNFPEEIR